MHASSSYPHDSHTLLANMNYLALGRLRSKNVRYQHVASYTHSGLSAWMVAVAVPILLMYSMRVMRGRS